MKPQRILFLAVTLIICSPGCKPEPTEFVEPVIVTIGGTQASATLTEVTLSSFYTINRGKITEAGFLFGTTPNLTVETAEKLLTTGPNGQLFAKKGNLQVDRRYYVRPFVVADGNASVGSETFFQTQKPVYASISDTRVGRGQRVRVKGTFLTDDKSIVSVTVGGLDAQVYSMAYQELAFLIPEQLQFGMEASVSIWIAGYEVKVAEKLTITRWTKLSPPTRNNQIPEILSSGSYLVGWDGKSTFYLSSKHEGAIYNLANDTWTMDVNLKTPATVINTLFSNKLFLPLEQSSLVGLAGNTTETVALWRFEYATKRWTEERDYPGLVFGAASAYNSKKIYWGMAPASSGNPIWEFDLTSSQWTQLPPSPVGSQRVRNCIAFATDQWLLVGNCYQSNTSSRGGFYAYSTSQKSWGQMQGPPDTGDTWFDAMCVFGDKGVVLAGNRVLFYDTEGHRWFEHEDRIPGPDKREDAILVAGPDFLLIGGGYVFSPHTEPIFDLYKFVPF